MSAEFQTVNWNRAKLVYDGIVLAGIALYLETFMYAGRLLGAPGYPVTWDLLRIRAFGSCAFLMLTITLSIGPLTRLDRRFLPFLYNRRHLGVMTFCVAALHAWYVVNWYAGHGKLPALVAVLAINPHYLSFVYFPFETLGLLALVILFVMAATSHDYWLAFLSPAVWKGVHMAVYAAYGLLVMHVALGVMQTERNPLVPLLLGGAFALVAALHLAADWRERHEAEDMPRAGWIAVGPARELPDQRARIVSAPGGERIAVFRDGNRFAAVTNLCAHQHGPLGEGRIIDGCITCPWHGFQYRLEDGCSPPPFTEKIATHRVRLVRGAVEVEAAPQPPGTALTPAQMMEERNG